MIADTENNRVYAKSQQGIALLLVLFALAIGSIYAFTFLSSSNTTITIAQNINAHAEARCIAESGLEIAIKYVYESTDWRTTKTPGEWFVDQPLLDGTYTLSALDIDNDFTNNSEDKVTFTVTGKKGNVTHTVSAIVTPSIQAQVVADPDLHVLFPVFDENSLSDYEQSYKDFLESLNYHVNLITYNSSVADYEDSFDQNNVVFALHMHGNSTVTSRMKNAGIGFVCSDPNIFRDMRLSSSAAAFGNSSLKISNTLTSITSGITSGNKQILVASENIGLVYGTMPSDAKSVAVMSSISSYKHLVACEVGIEDLDGHAIPDRRVFVPFYRADAGALTDLGKNLLQNSILWAAQNAVISGSPNTLVAHYQFDEDKESLVAPDIGPYSLNAVVGEGKPHSEFKSGYDNNALKLHDCGNGYAYVPHNDALNLTTAGTISVWINPEKTDQYNGIVHKGNSADWSDEAYSLEFHSSNKLSFRLSTGSTIHQLLSSSSISKNQWTHVVASWSPSGMKIYVNGSLDAHNAEAVVVQESSGSLQILNLLYSSSSNTTKTYATKGYVDELQLYGSAVTDEQVTQLYNLEALQFTQTLTVGDPDEIPVETNEPIAVVLYSFDQPTIISPDLVAHFPLDDDVDDGGEITFQQGLIAKEDIRLQDDLKIDSKLSEGGPSGSYEDDLGYVATNSTAFQAISMMDQAEIKGNANVGPGANVSDAIKEYDGSKITENKSSLSSTNYFPNSITIPSDLPASSGALYTDDKIDITEDATYDYIYLDDHAELKIKEDVRIHVLGDVTLKDKAKIKLEGNHDLIMYVGGNILLDYENKISEKKYPERTYIVMYGDNKEFRFSADKKCTVNAVLYNPLGEMRGYGEGIFYGGIVVNNFIAGYKTELHLDPRIGQEVPSNLGITGGSTVIDDVSAVDNNGVCVGATGGYDGPNEKVVKFDGSDDYVLIPHHANYMLDNGALSFWFKPETLGGLKGLFGKDATQYGDGGHVQVYLSDGDVGVKIESNNNHYFLQHSGIQVGNWYHVVINWGGDGFELYLNNQLVDRMDYHAGFGPSSGGAGNTESIILGASAVQRPSGTDEPFEHFYHGYMDDVRIYNAPIDPGQIDNLYNKVNIGNRVAANPVIADTSNYLNAASLYLTDSSQATWTSDGLHVTGNTAAFSDSHTNNISKVATAINSENEFTIELKVTPDNLSQHINTLSYSNSSTTRNFSIAQSSDQYYARVTTNATSYNGTPNITCLSTIPQSMQHIIMTYDGSQVKIYRNGSLDKTETRTGSITWNDSFHMILGREYTSTSSAWQGTYHRVCIYNKALDIGQISNVYNGLPPGPPGAGSEFKAVWVESE
ncbi:LamG domain-containing protein [Planctomycetota bacterium]|nr:LamG domain-containing protein [Planctomycetota bacterium]